MQNDSTLHPLPARAARLSLATAAVLAALGVSAAAAPSTRPAVAQTYDATDAAARDDFAGGFEQFLRRATTPPSQPALTAAPAAELVAEVDQTAGFAPLRNDDKAASPATRPAAAVQPATPTATPTARPMVDDGQLDKGKLRIVANDSRIVRTSRPYSRVSVAAPAVADVTPLGPDTLLVSTRSPGLTQLVLWDDDNQSQTLFVQSEADLRAVQAKLDDLLGGREVEAVDLNGKIALRGRVRSAETAAMAADIAGAFGNGEVLNFIELSGTQQVTLSIRFAEVSRTAVKQLGVNFGYADGTGSGANTIGQISPITPGAGTTGGVAGDLGFPVGVLGSSVSLFGGGRIGQTAFEVFLSALRENNLLRVLAQPNLTVISGQSAEFQAGGRIPIPVPQALGATTITFENYGIILRATPIVLGDGRIRVLVSPEVSDIDRSNGIVSDGISIPGFTTRRLSTEVELMDGQTFVLAGLLNSNVNAIKQSVPLLGDVPILGTLFRSTRYQRRETELVVLITPHLVAPLNPGEVPPLPGEDWKHPNEIELFLGGQMGGEAGVGLPSDGDVGGRDDRATRSKPKLQTQYTFLPPEPAAGR